jgi:hypothetical protein
LQRLVTSPVVEQEGYGVAEDFAQQPAGQVPEIPGPHLLDGVATRELAEDGVDPIAQAAQERAPLGGGIALLAPVRCEELDAHSTRQLFLCLGRVVVAVPDGEPVGELDEPWYDGELVGVGRGHRKAGDDAGPADPEVHPEPVEGLPESSVSFPKAASPRKRLHL